jgi:serine/threonine protein kinase
LFSVGIVAYELLTTRPLFGGRSELETLRNVECKQVVPPRKRNPRCPADLNDIVMTALSRDPTLRWQSAAAMRFAIENVGREVGRASSREVREWIEWAFNLPTPAALRRSGSAPASPAAGSSSGQYQPPSPDSIDDVSIQIVWGTDDSSSSMGLGTGGDPAAGASEAHEPFDATTAITAEITIGDLERSAPPPMPSEPPSPAPERPAPKSQQTDQRTLLGVPGVGTKPED